MPVFREEKVNNFTVMSNYHLRDKNLSYKAKGLLSFMLSLPDDWDYSLNGLCAVSKESKKAIRNMLNELKEHVYLEIIKAQEKNGRFKYNYMIYEKSCNCENKEKKIEKIHVVHNSLTVELINEGYVNEDDFQLLFYDRLFDNLLFNGYTFDNLKKVIHYIVKSVQNRDFKDEYYSPIKNKFAYFKEAIENCLLKLEHINDELLEN